jgi:DNA-binding NarL/FixJ family response regulator
MSEKTGSPELRVLVASWNKIYYEGLISVINSRADAQVVDICTSGQDAIQSASKTRPNVVFIDQGIKDCEFIELSNQLRTILPNASIFVVTSPYYHGSVLHILKANANFYIDKEITVSGLNTLLDKLYENKNFMNIEFFICPPVAEQLINEIRKNEPESESGTPLNEAFGLTKRELEVLDQIVQEKSNKEIAQALFITENTVKVHISRIFEKLHIKARQQAASVFNTREKVG